MDSKKTLILSCLLISGLMFCGCERINPERLLLVRTGSASSITYQSCTLSGELVDIREDVTRHGFCYNLTGDPTVQVSTVESSAIDLGPLNSASTFQGSLSGLRAETEYFVRAYATDSEGTVYGEEISFITAEPPGTPVLVTTSVTSITEISALSGGSISSDGGAEVTARGICWSLDKEPTLDDEFTIDGSGTGSFKSDLTGLYCGETYYVRAYATNLAGTAYGPEQSFTTKRCSDLNYLLVEDRDGIWRISDDGIKSSVFTSLGEIEIRDGLVYFYDYFTLYIYNADFSLNDSYSVSNRLAKGNMCALPEGKQAFISNSSDSVTIVDASGKLEKRVSLIGESSNTNLQMVNGLVVDNRLIVSEDGDSHIMQFDLTTYARSEFRNCEHLSGWLGDLAYSNERFYLLQSQKIYSFREDEEEQLICTLPEGNNTGIVVHGKYGYVTSNFGNKIYKVNLATGGYEVFVTDLNYPQDIALME